MWLKSDFFHQDRWWAANCLQYLQIEQKNLLIDHLNCFKADWYISVIYVKKYQENKPLIYKNSQVVTAWNTENNHNINPLPNSTQIRYKHLLNSIANNMQLEKCSIKVILKVRVRVFHKRVAENEKQATHWGSMLGNNANIFLKTEEAFWAIIFWNHMKESSILILF